MEDVLMKEDIKQILLGVKTLHRQLNEIQIKLNEQPVQQSITQSYGPPKDPNGPITPKQLDLLEKKLIKKSHDYVQEKRDKYNVKYMKELTKSQASELLDELMGPKDGR